MPVLLSPTVTMEHLGRIENTQSNVVWSCCCGWMTWAWRAQHESPRNARLVKAWRKHLTMAGTKEIKP